MQVVLTGPRVPMAIWTVFREFLWLGCVSFGGPAAHVGYFHRRFVTGLGWLDDRMGMGGPSEEDHHYVADTGATPAESREVVEALKCRDGWNAGRQVGLGGSL